MGITSKTTEDRRIEFDCFPLPATLPATGSCTADQVTYTTEDRASDTPRDDQGERIFTVDRVETIECWACANRFFAWVRGKDADAFHGTAIKDGDRATWK